MATLIAAYDWASTPLGTIEHWPTSLTTTVGLLLLSPVPIALLWGEQGTMIYNDAYSLVAGGRHPQLLGSAVREGWPEVADFNDNVMKVGLAGGTLSYEDQELILYRTGSAEQVWLNLDYSPVIGEDGLPAGVIAIVVETTRNVGLNRRLRENEARLRFLDELQTETANIGDADNILAITTRMVGQHLGVAICAYADMEPDEDHFTIRGDWSAPGSPSIVGYYSLADFGKLAVENLGAGLPLVINDNLTEISPEEAATFQSIGIGSTICMPLVKEGRLTALMAIHHKGPHTWTADELALIREVTERCWAHIERVRSEAEVRAAEAQFRTLAEAMPNHVWTALPDGQLDWFNAQIYSYTGAQRGELDEGGWRAFIHPDDLPRSSAEWARSLATGNDYAAEFRIRRHDGSYRWYISRAVPIHDQGGQVVRWIGNNTDVDDQKNAEVLLERRLEERTQALARASEHLQQAQKMEAIGNLTGGVAHDFNNLLMAVFGSLELLRKRMPQEPGLLRLVDNAMEGARRGTSLIQRMLAFARRQELKAEPIDLSHLIGGMTDLLQRSLGPMVRVDTVFDPDLPLVVTDSNQLESALLNLAVNARDAMDGEGVIVISAVHSNPPAEAGLPAGDYVCLTIRDNGAGMDAQTLQRATEPFFTTKGVGKGTGLGLSMVHGLAEQSGGKLVLRSTVGVGTSAEIWLPAQAAAVTPQLAVPNRAAVAGPGAAERSLRILVVDDDALVALNTEAMLEDLGHHVRSVYSAEQALKLLEADEFEVVVTDHAMPQMTGAQLAEAIRRRWPDLPIILATGYADLPPGVATQLPRLSKPFSQAELASVVQRAAAAR